MRPRRHVRRPPDLTSLFDVLFIVVFAALIRAAAVQNAAEHPKAAAPPATPLAPEVPPAVAALRDRALADLDARLHGLAPLIVRITRDGTIDALEADGRRVAVVEPLLEPGPAPDALVMYAGFRSAARRVCGIAARRLGARDLSRYVVIMAPAVSLHDLPEALKDGLQTDVERCQTEQRGIAALVDPSTLAPVPAAPAPPAPTAPAPAPRGAP